MHNPMTADAFTLPKCRKGSSSLDRARGGASPDGIARCTAAASQSSRHGPTTLAARRHRRSRHGPSDQTAPQARTHCNSVGMRTRAGGVSEGGERELGCGVTPRWQSVRQRCGATEV